MANLTKIKKQSAFLLLILFFAAFNDILRIHNTKISLFRLTAFFAFVFCLSYKKIRKKMLIIFFGFTFFSFLQTYLFYSIFSPYDFFLPIRFVQYYYFYWCIFVVICLVIVLYEKEKSVFQNEFYNFLIFISILYAILILVKWKFVGTHTFLNNENDYGAMCAAVIPILLYKSRKNIFYLLYVFMICFALVVMDCKLAEMAICFQIFLFLYLYIRNKLTDRFGRLLLLLGLLTIGVILISFVIYSNIFFSGYPFDTTVIDPIRHLLKNELYVTSDSSSNYRANVIIVGMRWIWKTKFMGIGIGNTGILLRNVLENQGLFSEWLLHNAISAHNSIIEFVLEFGFIAIVIILSVIHSIFRLLKKKYLTPNQITYIIILSSSLLWLLGPSGILTDYYIFMLFTFLYLQNRTFQTNKNLGITKSRYKK